MGSSRNKSAGHSYERLIVNELKPLYPSIFTSRSESRNMDDKGVDIVGEIPYHIQCKNSKTNPNYVELLTNMPQDKPGLIFHRKTKKAVKKFITVNDYVVMTKKTFYDLIWKLENLKE